MKSKTKIKVGLIYGGPSSEYEVSLNTAGQIKKYLSKNKYQVIPIHITKAGAWPKNFKLENLKKKIDFAFIAIHGQFGEDGTLQALLEAENILYSGSGILASSLAMDKYRSGLLAKSVGLKIPQTSLGSNFDSKNFPKQVIVKPNTGGSSVDVKIISWVELAKLKPSANIVVQEYIAGKECTVSVLQTPNGVMALPVIEIIPKSKFYDYKSKYKQGGSEHIIPASISKILSDKLQKSALLIHKTLGCTGMSRSDFIIKGNHIYYLETNTIPGMTKTSLLPQAAASIGIEFPELLDLIIHASL